MSAAALVTPTRIRIIIALIIAHSGRCAFITAPVFVAVTSPTEASEIETGNGSSAATLPDVLPSLKPLTFDGGVQTRRFSRRQAPVAATHAKAAASPGSRKSVETAEGHTDRGSNVPATQPDVKEIWMIGLFPMKGSWAGGLGQKPAVEMGLEDVNADPNILPGYKLLMTDDDTQVSFQIVEVFSGQRD